MPGLQEQFFGIIMGRDASRRLPAEHDDEQLAMSQRHFLYMPLMHAEDLGIQAKNIERFEALRDYAEWILQFARDHRQEIVDNGRFTGRDEALGRSD